MAETGVVAHAYIPAIAAQEAEVRVQGQSGPLRETCLKIFKNVNKR